MVGGRQRLAERRHPGWGRTPGTDQDRSGQTEERFQIHLGEPLD